MTTPRTNMVSSNRPPILPSTLIISKLTSLRSKSATQSTASTAISASCRPQRLTLKNDYGYNIRWCTSWIRAMSSPSAPIVLDPWSGILPRYCPMLWEQLYRPCQNRRPPWWDECPCPITPRPVPEEHQPRLKENIHFNNRSISMFPFSKGGFTLHELGLYSILVHRSEGYSIPLTAFDFLRNFYVTG